MFYTNREKIQRIIELALEWFEKSADHQFGCDDETCEWYLTFADFSRRKDFKPLAILKDLKGDKNEGT